MLSHFPGNMNLIIQTSSPDPPWFNMTQGDPFAAIQHCTSIFVFRHNLVHVVLSWQLLGWGLCINLTVVVLVLVLTLACFGCDNDCLMVGWLLPNFFQLSLLNAIKAKRAQQGQVHPKAKGSKVANRDRRDLTSPNHCLWIKHQGCQWSVRCD